MTCKFDWRNPPLWFRILLVAFVMTMPGILAGEIASLFFGNPLLNGGIGALGGALFGILIELWPPLNCFNAPQAAVHQTNFRGEINSEELKQDGPKARSENNQTLLF